VEQQQAALRFMLDGAARNDVCAVAMDSDKEELRRVLHAGHDPNALCRSGSAALALAAGAGLEDNVAELIAVGAQVNQATLTGDTPLCLAAWAGHGGVVAHLLDGGADPNVACALGTRALDRALRGYHHAIADQLLAVGADPDVVDGDASALSVCVSRRSPECLRLLLEYGADAEVVGPPPMPTLLWAVAEERLEMVSLLLEHGFDPMVLFDSLYPLCCALFRGNVEAVEKVLEAGASPDGMASDVFSPVTAAIGAGKVSCVRSLLRAGADVTGGVLSSSLSALVAALGVGGSDMVELLLDYGEFGEWMRVYVKGGG
jgi:ankyrin repeat protein